MSMAVQADPEIPWQATAALESWQRTLEGAERPAKAMLFTRAATEVLRLASRDAAPAVRQGLVDELYALGQHHGLAGDVVQILMGAATVAGPDLLPDREPSPWHVSPEHDEAPLIHFRPESADGDRDDAPSGNLIQATPFAVRDPATIPVRDMLYGRHLVRGFVSGLVGIGGSGKSTLVMAENFARATDRALLGIKARAPLRCWSVNLEDPRDELDRRAQATCQHFELSDGDISGRMFLDSGRDQPMVVARTLAGGTRIIEPVVDNIVSEIVARGIDVLTVDPFVSCHEVPENDNGAIDLVIKKGWGIVAERGNCAVELVHHLRKIGDDEPTIDAARGAVAFVAGCRAVRVVAGMTKAEAERAGIENPYRYFRVFSGKLNMAPREDKSDWYFLESVNLGNGGAGPSDHVQVAVPWTWPNALDGLATRDLFAVQKRVSEGQWRESAASPEWIGKAVAEVLDLDIETAPVQNRIKSLLKTWLKTGALKVVTKLDDHRKERKFVEVGQWATD